jgi:hypothetical protein
MVENAFGLLKTNWREMLEKTEMHVAFVHDMFKCCYILHNITNQTRATDMDVLMEQLALEAKEQFCKRPGIQHAS